VHPAPLKLLHLFGCVQHKELLCNVVVQQMHMQHLLLLVLPQQPAWMPAGLLADIVMATVPCGNQRWHQRPRARTLHALHKFKGQAAESSLYRRC
jgi:hypothetical protein